MAVDEVQRAPGRFDHMHEAASVYVSVCPRTDTHLNYMINIALTKEFAITAISAGRAL
jgi:hypothetical protein